MKIDLCKLLGVEEGEEFIVEFKDGHKSNCKYRVMNNIMEWSERGTKYDGDYNPTCFSLNDVNKVKNIIRLPKKKQFKDDELCILRNIDKEYKWIARDKVDKDEYDKYGNLNIYFGKPKKSTKSWLPSDVYCEFHGYNHLLQSIKWEDEEPIYIDDYVER